MPVRTLNWIYSTDRLPLWHDRRTLEEGVRQRQLEDLIGEALGQLTTTERAVIERHDLEGRSFADIATEWGWSATRVQTTRRRALRRLRKLLASYVEKRFGIIPPPTACPICASTFRRQAETIIAARTEDAPYSTVIDQLRRHLGIKIISPMTIVGHTKYHC